ncbi:MAG: sulfite exporter TauE/SafE family protein [Desulfobacteraceae bacterium]|nr:sulfite exporter TauE/SafE family protein [Desulfobacteraceae bacterium]
MDTQLQLWQILAANGAIGLGALIQSATGFGMGLVSVPLLALIDTALIPGPFIFSAIFQLSIMVFQNRRNIVRNQAMYMFSGVLPGTILAGWMLGRLQGEAMGTVFGVTILVAVVMSCWGIRVPLGRRSLWGAGTLCGIMGTISGMGGPPLIIVYQDEPGPRIRGNLGIVFLFSSLFSLAALSRNGLFDFHHAALGLLLIPGILTGTLLAPPFARFLDSDHLKPVLLFLTAMGAVALILRDLL